MPYATRDVLCAYTGNFPSGKMVRPLSVILEVRRVWTLLSGWSNDFNLCSESLSEQRIAQNVNDILQNHILKKTYIVFKTRHPYLPHGEMERKKMHFSVRCTLETWCISPSASRSQVSRFIGVVFWFLLPTTIRRNMNQCPVIFDHVHRGPSWVGSQFAMVKSTLPTHTVIAAGNVCVGWSASQNRILLQPPRICILLSFARLFFDCNVKAIWCSVVKGELL